MTTHRHSRADLLAAIDRMGGASGLTSLLAFMPGGAGGGIGALLLAAERAVKAGDVYIHIRTKDPEMGEIHIDIEDGS